MVRTQRDINTITLESGISYSDFQPVRDMALASATDINYIKSDVGRLQAFDMYARKEWENREAQALMRIDAIERALDIQKGNSEGILRSSAAISGALTLIGMFIAIYISVVVR